MKWLRALTYVAAAAAGVVAFFVPPAAAILVPVGIGLAAWATRHPSDAATPAALEELARMAAEAAAKVKR